MTALTKPTALTGALQRPANAVRLFGAATRIVRSVLVLSISGALLAACGDRPAPPRPASSAPSGDVAGAVRVVETGRPLQCVPFARRLSEIDIRGDAWTWWKAAEGRYERGNAPEPGAVLVIRRQGNSDGHLAVVTAIVRDRVILADHANWLNRGRIFENTPIRDVSARGDWSKVRVWYPPGRTWGRRVYAAYGFIYRKRQQAQAR